METSHSPPLDIAVVGAGFSGLAAALRLSDLATASQRACRVTVYEAAAQVGGLVQTQRIGEYLVERGADSFITNKPGGVELCRRLGLESRLIGTEPQSRRSFILRNGRPVATPAGFQLLAPTKVKPFLATPLLSWRGKLRVLAERFIPPRRNGGDESLGDFVQRRFGREVLERVIQPLVGGIYTSDPFKLSLAATMPRFLDMERESGSVLKGLMRSLGNDADASGARYGMFATLPGGLGELQTALVEAFERAGGVIRTSTRATCVQPRSDESGRWQVTAGGETAAFDAVVISLPAYRTAELVQPWDDALSGELEGIEYASSAIVVSGHRLAEVAHPLNGAGLVIPHLENRRIIAVSFGSRKFPGRAPDGRVLLRTFVGGAMQPDMMNFGDDELRRIVLEELHELLGVRGTPDFAEVVRYERGMPQYHVGHLDRVKRIEQLASKHAGFGLCGNAYRGVGMPDAIESGFRAAEQLWRSLSTRGAASAVAG